MTYFVTTDKPDVYLASKLGNDYGWVRDMQWVELSGIKLGKYDRFDVDNIPSTVIGGDQTKVFDQVMDNVSNFHYRTDQADPTIVLQDGGNCQAISLYLYKQFSLNGLPTELDVSQGLDHMTVKVSVDGVWYSVDKSKEKVVKL